MKSYSKDLKERILAFYINNPHNMREVATIFGVGKSSISRWLNPRIKKVRLNFKHFKIKKCLKVLLKNGWIKRIKDIKHLLEDTYNISKSISTIWRVMKDLKYSYKRLRKKTIKKTNSEEVIIKYKEECKEIGYDNILCFDEVGFQIEMVPKYGWSEVGERCYYKTSMGGRKNYTGSFLIGSKGIVKWDVSKEGMNKEKLLDFFNIDKELVEGKTLVLDNLRVHHNKEYKEKLEQLEVKGKWLPPYSPELNPIEEVFWMDKEGVKILYNKNRKRITHGTKKINKYNKQQRFITTLQTFIRLNFCNI